MIRSLALAAAAAGLMAVAAPTGATAAPISTAPRLDVPGGAMNVHWRGWRHCHWRYGERYCHGGRRWNRGWDGPGIYLNFGKRHHGHHRGKYRKHRKHRN